MGNGSGKTLTGKALSLPCVNSPTPIGKKVVIFGAGGAARAISVEVALAGASHITIVNRSIERGEELTKLLQDKLPCYADFAPWENTFAIPEKTDVVINATSIGLFPDVDARLDFDLNTLTSNMVVADVIPNPPATNLVRDAQEKGCKVIDGLSMLVNQGVIGIKHWTGIDPDPTVMRAALEKVFG
jgi:shikimate dehydrogenase